MNKIIRELARSVRDLALQLGLGPKLNEDNRRVLEKSIFPVLSADPSVNRILFVGCHWYTWHYPKLVPGKEFCTLEIDPRRARYGASHHIIDSVENVEQHFQASSIDVIMILGVIGWGLDDPVAIESSLAACQNLLRGGGMLILGCDEVPEHTPVDLQQSATLQSSTPFVFPGLQTSRYRCEGDLKHTFLFFTK